MKNEQFSRRHTGITAQDLPQMLEVIGVNSVDELIEQVFPANIRLPKPLQLPQPLSEQAFLTHIRALAQKNRLFDNYIGLGYYGTVTPSVILRNVFENPVWYTSYTPYQAEISQGRLEALLNFQTMVCDLTALPLTNCSLLDEATAAAEAMTMLFGVRSREQQKAGVNTLFVDEKVFPQTLAVLHTRAVPQGITLLVGDFKTFDFSTPIFGAIVQYPNSDGAICCYREFTEKCHAHAAGVAVAADLMSLTLIAPPGEWDADIAFGSAQRMGIPLFYGGPSAAYFAAKEQFKRQIPGRIIGISKDANDKPALRLALQTREQHIKREKATSNICTAQALLATMAGFYAAYHGCEGLQEIALGIHSKAMLVAEALNKLGCKQHNDVYFDTLKITLPTQSSVQELRLTAETNGINLRYFEDDAIGISLDEATTTEGIAKLIATFASVLRKNIPTNPANPAEMKTQTTILDAFLRHSKPLQHAIFEQYHSETEMMRYITRLARKDISLTQSMISLGSCTMKLNAATEMLPLSWAEFQSIHPFAPKEQAAGYHELIDSLAACLAEITGFAGVSLQPNSGAAGEYAGLITIRNYLYSIGQGNRDVVLIPASAHGTNPASAVQAGYEVVVTACDELGNVDILDLKAKTEQYRDRLAALMITYPSTHGVFEPAICEICDIIHSVGAQVYMDGANMNAQVGLTSPGHIGADVCHLNLHKTFASPHGGGGPGVGPICVAEHLIPFLPQHGFEQEQPLCTAVSAAPWGSAGILPITYGYILMMGEEGLTEATKMAIVSANYLAKRLEKDYGIVYTGVTGRVGHEMILDCRQFKAGSGITESDIAKRLMDFGFHAPTLSFPVHGTLMVEPTESESLAELDRFVETLMTIRTEIDEVAEGIYPIEDNVLVNAPHPDYVMAGDVWTHPYSREKAAYPLLWVRDTKFWLPVARVDNAFGDRNLVCCAAE
jgi:glycine dehydrogenase